MKDRLSLPEGGRYLLENMTQSQNIIGEKTQEFGSRVSKILSYISPKNSIDAAINAAMKLQDGDKKRFLQLANIFGIAPQKIEGHLSKEYQSINF